MSGVLTSVIFICNPLLPNPSYLRTDLGVAIATTMSHLIDMRSYFHKQLQWGLGPCQRAGLSINDNEHIIIAASIILEETEECRRAP